MNPMASAPREAQATASSTRVRPHILIWAAQGLLADFSASLILRCLLSNPNLQIGFQPIARVAGPHETFADQKIVHACPTVFDNVPPALNTAGHNRYLVRIEHFSHIQGSFNMGFKCGKISVVDIDQPGIGVQGFAEIFH